MLWRDWRLEVATRGWELGGSGLRVAAPPLKLCSEKSPMYSAVSRKLPGPNSIRGFKSIQVVLKVGSRPLCEK